jgi:hypothetical protein
VLLTTELHNMDQVLEKKMFIELIVIDKGQAEILLVIIVKAFLNKTSS